LAFNVAFRILSDPDAAADATQDAFLSAYRALPRFRGGSFRSWLAFWILDVMALPFVITLILVLGILAQWLAWRLHVPAIVLLAAAGLLAGPGLGWIDQLLRPCVESTPTDARGFRAAAHRTPRRVDLVLPSRQRRGNRAVDSHAQRQRAHMIDLPEER